MSSSRPYHLKLIVAAIFWALTPIFGRILAEYQAPYALALGRFLVASVVLYALFRASGLALPRLTWRQASLFALLGFTGVCLHNVLVFKGVEYTEANRANVIFSTIAIIVAVLDFALFGKRFRLGALAGIALGVAGTIVVITDGRPGDLLQGAIGVGDLLILASAASWALYSVLGRPLLAQLPELTVTLYAAVFGTALLVPFTILDAGALPALLRDARALAMIAFLGVFGSAFGFLWYYQAVDRLGAMAAAAYINLVPIFGVALAALILGEVPSPALLAGGALVIVGLFLINHYEAKHVHRNRLLDLAPQRAEDAAPTPDR